MLGWVEMVKNFMTQTKSVSMFFSVTESASALTSLNCSGDGGQIVAIKAGRTRGRTGLAVLDGDSFMSYLASMFFSKQRLRWTINLPVCFPTDDVHLWLNGESQVGLFSCRHPWTPLTLPQSHCRMLAEDNVLSGSSLCHPALRERTLRRLSEAGSLQALIDQWGHSSLEELEAFIDTYFEMVWEQTMKSFEPTEPDRSTTEQHEVLEVDGHKDVLSSIDRRLSKLGLLEEIKRDLTELRTSVEHSRNVIQELRDKSKQDENKTC